MTEPPIIRQNKPHEITVSEGSQVAASRSLDLNAPQVRRTLASDRAGDDIEPTWTPDIPPAIAASAPADGTVFERHAHGTPAAVQEAPAALERAATDESIVFERSIQDGEGADAPVITRALKDHLEALPDAIEPQDSAQGPVIERSSSDHFVQAPDVIAGEPASPGPSVTTHVQDHFVPVPPREGASAAPAKAMPGVARRVMPRGRVEPAPPPMPAGQAQALIQETARQSQAKVEETLGAADSSWVEMDFPARVVHLKIENDKVRTKLEQLERLTRQAPF